MTKNDLPDTLERLLRSGTRSNPALQALVHDCAKFHATLAVLAALATAGLVLLTVFTWRRSRAFAIATAALSLFMAVLFYANASNAMNPRHDVATTIPVLRATKPGTEAAGVQRATNRWLLSGSATKPRVLQQKIDERLSWQRPKAIITGVLFFAFLGLCFAIRRRPIIRAAAMLCTLVLLVMAMANTEAAIAPMFLTVLYG